MSNFEFLKYEWPNIYRECKEAEDSVFTKPRYAAIMSRSALEKIVHWLYQNDGDLEQPYDTSLAALIHEQSFRDNINQRTLREINIIRKTGNNAAHGKSISQYDSLNTIKCLFSFTSFLGLYYGDADLDIPKFDEKIIPTGSEKSLLKEELELLQAKLSRQENNFKLERKELEKQLENSESLKAELKKVQQKVKERRQEREQNTEIKKAVPLLLTEAQTRKIYIDLSLKEAGWDNLQPDKDIEYEVRGMPRSTNPSGKGYVDYVLWGDNGLPLAVVEAKKTMVDASKGKHQASLYADCLEQMTGQRPLIFYTNGFETYLWDDTFYPERQVYGFYTKDELQLLIGRRTQRKELDSFKVNEDITNRAYQMEAIKRVAETFTRKNRKALLVMATGSGKTRTSASIVDMLTKTNWAKRILFLADRNALVTQAKNAFKLHLPHLSAIDLTKEKEENQTRLVFSTYPTIMNKIDALKTDDKRFYGIGHFDLIIIDEAHRSVYQKYKAIFDYFDSLLVGLTATPKKNIDHNTYGLFEIEDDNPTYAYELTTAVKEKYLVPPKAISVPLKFAREGIKYNQLTKAEQKEYEEKFGDPTQGEAPDEIGSNALNKWLFNSNTVDQVLDHLMTNGIKVSGGDKLGKTIMFATNHKHAIFIQERFNKNYPEYAGKFLRVIDNYEEKAQDILEKFCYDKEELEPQIAVSVDMMDTGVDAPRVVNLVFFKAVKSVTKFWQMIGRGTRLRPDLFAPNEDKKEFVIFDFCENFEFFEEYPGGMNATASMPISQQIFMGKLELSQLILQNTDTIEDEEELCKQYLSDLHKLIEGLDKNRFVVKKEMRYVEEYSVRARWDNISKTDIIDIQEHLSNLPTGTREDNEVVIRFDLLTINLQIALKTGSAKQSNYINRISKVGKQLYPKRNILAVQLEITTIKQVQTDEFWKAVDLKSVEKVRKSLRGLMKLIDKENIEIVYTHFEDNINIGASIVKDPLGLYKTLESYKDRVESYIRKNKHHIVIHKLNTNIPITKQELEQLENILFDGKNRGTKEDYKSEFGDMPLGKFIRKIVGLDINAAQSIFAKFISSESLTGDQITFVNNIISYLTKNGTIDKNLLFESPFTNAHYEGLTGIFTDGQVVKIVRLIDDINANADIG